MPEIKPALTGNEGDVANKSSTVMSYKPFTNNDMDQTILALRQENMILVAEKSGLQAELIFYKNELAKMCLSTGATFPIFRQPESVSSHATTQILAKNYSSTRTFNS